MQNPIRLHAIAAALLCIALPAHAAEVTGAGASLPTPLYVKWSEAYKLASNHQVNYQSIGSGGGIRQAIAKTVDFGTTDIPLSEGAMQKDGLVQFPTVLGGVVVIANLPGVDTNQLRLSGGVLADIYQGKITRWDDAAIKQLNPDVSLPGISIAVIRRLDGSGSSFFFTSFLSKTSAEWKQKVGEGNIVVWPVGLGGKGDTGVSAFVQRLPGAIGYVDYTFARQHKLAFTQLKNREGAFVTANEASLKAAAATAWQQSTFAEVLTDQAGKDAWPITAATFVVMRRTTDRPAQAVEVMKFFEWSYKNGGRLAVDTGFVPLPDTTVALVSGAWQQIRDADGKAISQAQQ